MIGNGIYYSDFDTKYIFNQNELKITFIINNNIITEHFKCDDNNIYYNKNKTRNIKIFNTDNIDKLVMMYDDKIVIEIKKYTLIHKLLEFLGYAI